MKIYDNEIDEVINVLKQYKIINTIVAGDREAVKQALLAYEQAKWKTYEGNLSELPDEFVWEDNEGNRRIGCRSEVPFGGEDMHIIKYREIR